MKKINFRFLLVIILALALVGLIIFLAIKADNFLVNFSLNLLTEIIGAVLIAIYLKSNISKGFVELTAEIKKQRDIQKINNAFYESDPEQAWNMVLDFKRRQLDSKKAELTEINPDEIIRRNQLLNEIEVLEKYIQVASAISAKK